MDNTHYQYKGKSWRPCLTKSDSNSFFHSAFGTRDREGEEFLDKDAQFRRMRWATFLTYFASKSKPPCLAEVLRKCFSADDKYKDASIGDMENFMKYISDIIASERNVTIEEIPILATLENIQIVVLSNTGPDPVITVKPNPDLLGKYPNVEKAKEEVVLCEEENIFSNLELVEEVCVLKLNQNFVCNKRTKKNSIGSQNHSDIYRKGGSAGSKGVRYQVNLLVMVLLNAFKNLREWKLSTENEDAGKFDDIVLEQAEGATFIQSKHKESGKKRITLNELTSTNTKNDDFSLPKYFLSYLQIKKKFKIKNVILCTNADVHEKVLKLLDQHDACSENILHFEGDYSFHTLKDEMLTSLKESTDSYYEQNFKNKGIVESEINDENLKEFQEHLQLYFNYPSLSRLEKIIDKSLSLTSCCKSSRGKICSSEIFPKMTEWYQKKEGIYLTQTYTMAMFSEIWGEKYCQELEEYEVSFHTDDLNFQPPTQIFHVITKGGFLLQVMKIYHAIRGYKTKILFVNLRDDIDIQKQAVEAFGLPQYTFLIIIWSQTITESTAMEVFGELKRILENKEHKKIIVLAEDNSRFIQQIGWDKDVVCVSKPVTLEDLHSVSQERLLKRKNIVFQGEKVSLEEILGVGDIEYYSRALNTEILEKLIRGEEIKVGARLSELDEYIDRYYISRSFKRKLDKTPDEKWNKGEKKENFLDDARPSGKDSTFHYKNLKFNEKLYVKLDKMYSDEMKQEEILSEANIYDVKEKVVVISDSAGTGKSTVLAKLALIIKENNPYLWVVRIKLNDFTKTLRDSLRNGKETVTITELLNSENTTKFKNRLEEFLFSASQKVVLLLDGVDEISPDYTRLILGLLKQCQEDFNFAKIFVTTRPHMIKELKQVSKVKPFSLQPFTEEDQIVFLINYWENGLQLKDDISKEKCRRYAEALLRKWMDLDTNEGHRFTTVPLQLRMMAEIFQDNATSIDSAGWKGYKEYAMESEEQPNTSERMNVTDLYPLFVKKKQLIFAEKGNPTGNTIASDLITKTFDNCFVYHQSLALEVILGKEKLHLFSCYKPVNKNIETQMLKIGIVQKTKEELHFIHRTFADYFVAECLFSELQQNPTLEFQKFLIDTIFVHPQYNVTRTFFDSLLRKFEKSLSPNIFTEYRSFKQESSMEFYKLRSHLLHLLAEGDCLAIFTLLLKCIDFKAVRGKEMNILNFYRAHFNKDVRKNIFGNTLNLLEYLTKEAGINIKDEGGRTPLHYATEKGHLEMTKVLVEGGADVNSRNSFGNTALHLAASNNHLKIIKFLLGRGADFSIKNHYGFTALQTATYYGQLETVKHLTEHGSDISVVSNDGSTLLHSASENGHLDTVKYLFELGIDPHIRDNDGFTALQTATYFGQLETVQFLTEHGSDINVVSNKRSTLLHLSSAKGHLNTVKYLFELGIDPHIRNSDGFTALQTAIYLGQLETVKYLTEHGFDVNIVCNDGSTLLHLASQNGHLDTVKYLFQLGIDSHIKDNDGFTALQTATYFGQLEIAKFLTELGSDINVVCNDGSTLLHLAGKNGHLDMVKYLYEFGIDSHIRDNDGFTALHVATVFGHLEIVKFLTEHGSEINTVSNAGRPLLYSASVKGHLDIVKYLFQLGVDPHIRDNDGFTALHAATYCGQLETVKFLTEHGSDSNVVCNDGSTLLHSASVRGHLDIIKYLFELGTDPYISNNNGITALQTATYFGHLETVKFLTEHGSDINVVCKEGNTLLHLAVENGHLDTIKYLFDLDGVDPHIRNNYGFTVLHGASLFGHLDVVKFLVARGSNVNDLNDYGQSVLHCAGENGYLGVVKYLLQIGADIRIRDCNGFTVLQSTTQCGDLKTIKFFVEEHGLDVNISSNNGYTLLHLASANGRLDAINYLLELGIDPNIRDNHGFTAFHLVDGNDQLEIVKSFIEYGLDVNTKSTDGFTLLHLSSANGFLEMVKFLLENGADFMIRDNDGFTPLHLAATWGQLEVVKLLVEHGADYNATTNDGRTPLHLVSEEGHSDTVKYFLELGVDCNVRDYAGRTALHLAVLADRLDVVKSLVEHGGDLEVADNGGHTALYFAVDIGHSDIVDFLMEMGTD